MFEQTFLFVQNSETGSTGFPLSGLAAIALKGIFHFSGGLERGRLDRGLVKIKGSDWEFKKLGLIFVTIQSTSSIWLH